MFPPLALDLAMAVTGILAGLGALGAGVGILVAGIKVGRFAERATSVIADFSLHFKRTEALGERTAKASESLAAVPTAVTELAHGLTEISEMLREDHRILFASIRGLQWEIGDLMKKDEHGDQAQTA